jgi:prepilin-type N-terminal cleavage/methylation domain-containing protein
MLFQTKCFMLALDRLGVHRRGKEHTGARNRFPTKEEPVLTVQRPTARQGFTLIELLVVVIIIGILSGIGMAQYRDAQDRSRNAGMMSLSKSVQLGLETFKTDYNGLPLDLVGGTDPKLYLAGNSQAVGGAFPVKYVPGGMLPRTPWSGGSQVAMDPVFYNNAALSQPWSDLMGWNPNGPPRKTVDEVMAAGGISDGAENLPGTVSIGTNGPAKRTDYGYIYYLGDTNSGRYFVAGVGKHINTAPIVIIKGN